MPRSVADSAQVNAAVVPEMSRGRAPRARAPSDEELIARVRTGDEAAFEALYDRYQLPLLAFCRHMVGTREDAEDALQQVFAAAHRHLMVERRSLQLKGWLYRAARERCVSVLRARSHAIALDEVKVPLSDGLVVADEIERRQELRETLVDLRRLPDDQRAALVLAEIGALSHQEIAAALDVRRDKVKALIFQARESLMSIRRGRSTDCRVIEAQLATLRGSALRRAHLRHHVDGCASCALFEAEVRRQRARLAVILPVIPTLALKSSVLSSVVGTAGSSAVAGVAVMGGAGGAGAAAAGTAAGGGSVVASSAAAGGLAAMGTSIAAKAVAVAIIAGGIGTGGVATMSQLKRSPSTTTASAASREPTDPVVPSSSSSSSSVASHAPRQTAVASTPRQPTTAAASLGESAPPVELTTASASQTAVTSAATKASAGGHPQTPASTRGRRSTAATAGADRDDRARVKPEAGNPGVTAPQGGKLKRPGPAAPKPPAGVTHPDEAAGERRARPSPHTGEPTDVPAAAQRPERATRR